jgi:long-chain acyl-CoA synthetase
MNNYKTISDILITASEKYRDKIAFIEIDDQYKERYISFKDLFECVTKLAFYLKELGIIKDDKVILLSENTIEWVIYFFAINYIGAVCVPLDPRLSIEDISKITSNSEAKICFISEKKLEESKIVENDFYRTIVDIKRIKNFEKKLLNNNYNKLACLIYTSGTTGDPKAVMLSNENYIANLKSIYSLNLANEKDIFLCLLPFYHSFPLMVNLLLPIMYGATSVILKTIRSDIIRKVIKEKKITVIPAVPLFYKNIMDGIIRKLKENKTQYKIFSLLNKICYFLRKNIHINLGKIIFHKLHKELAPFVRFFVSGGARLDPDVFRFFYGSGFYILEGYGLTEASPVVSFNPLGREKEGSVGKALLGVTVKIDSENSFDIGEILVKGDNVMLGYWKNSTYTNEVLVNGWLRTGDVGYIDKDGYLFITGRKKEIIVLSNGKNIYPDEIEDFFIKNIKDIDECVAIPVVETGEINLGIVIKSDISKKEEIKRMISYVSKLLPDYKRPRKIFFTDAEIPKTNLGKPKRNLVKKIFSYDKDLKSFEKEIIYEDPITAKVVNTIKNFVGKKDVVLENDLELDLGLDSLKKVELSLELENALGLKLPDAFMVDILTVKDLVEHLKKIEFTSDGVERKNFDDLILEMPDKEDIRQIEIRNNLIFKFLEFVFFIFIKLTANIFYKIEVAGLNKIRDIRTNFIIAPNHLSYLDGYVVASILDFEIKRRIFFIGLADFFDRTLLKIFKKPAGVLSFDEVKEPVRAIKTSIYVIKKGYSICIFPEGARSYDGKLMELKKGIAYIAKHTKVPLFPVYIDGTFDAWPRFKKYPRFFKKIKIIIGEPIFWKNIPNYNEDDFLKEVKNSLILLSKEVENLC